MLSARSNGLTLLRFSSLAGLGKVAAAVTTRHGDDSGASGFDLAVDNGDPERARQNLGRLQKALCLKRLVYAHQVHGDRIVAISGDEPLPAARADGMATDRPGVGLLIRQADCQAIVLAAPGRAVANLHVGWRGNVADMPGKGVAFMQERYGAAPESLHAAISPSLGPCCAEFVNYRDELPRSFEKHMAKPNHFDLWAVSKGQLAAAGMRPERIEISGLCTKCGRDFYSHRRGEKARFGTVVALMNGVCR